MAVVVGLSSRTHLGGGATLTVSRGDDGVVGRQVGQFFPQALTAESGR